MKAWRVYSKGDMRLDDIPVPEVKPGWVLIKVRTLQPSITEVEMFKGIALNDEMNLDRLLADKGPLQLFGHEFCGEVIEVGTDVHNVHVGDRVFYWRRAPCGKCALCLSGQGQMCFKGLPVGLEIPGCLAEYVLLPGICIASIPSSISDSEAAAMQPLVTIVATIAATSINMGDTIVVLGQGAMGMNVTQVSQLCGAGKIIAVDIRDEVLALSRKFGATIAVNSAKDDLIQVVKDATDGSGADVVFECAGGSPSLGLSGTDTMNQALRVVRDQGKVTQIAHTARNAMIEVAPINMKGIQFRGLGLSSKSALNYTVEIVASKRVDFRPLITHTLEGLEKVPESFEITANKQKFGAINPAQVRVAI